MTRLKQLHILKAIFKSVLFAHNKTPKVFCLTFGVHVRSGVASFFLPGLGQMICGEFGRGFAFFGGFVGCYYIGGLSIVMGTGYDEDGNVLYHSPGSAIAGTAFITGALAIYVMSIIDAKRVAIVKNMYEQDLNRAYPLEMKVYPSLDYALIGNTYQPTAGIKLAVKF